jgi:wyosine [tRNA(Phe)-imidazoG37] synthetase (radical SAM superfamily)
VYSDPQGKHGTGANWRVTRVVLPLQDDVLYGPILSRRLGRSLGINLMPSTYKLCSFNCLYCHYGWTAVHTLDAEGHSQDLPPLESVVERIGIALRSALEFDYLTFSGNGEPTLYPQFAELVDRAISLRDQYRPGVRLALLSNSTGLYRSSVRESIPRIDLPVLKLDAGTPELFRAINRPVKGVEFGTILDGLASLERPCIQTLVVDGSPSNVSGEHLTTYLQHIARIKPAEVHIYSIDRPVPDPHLVRVSPQRLLEIARLGEAQTGATFRAFWIS